MKIAPLEKVLTYQNQNILNRFLALFPMPKEEAAIIYEDMKRWLWLYATVLKRKETKPDTPDVYISMSLVILDEMWHSFILNTEAYTQFCQANFGTYLHHPPLIPKWFENVKKHGEERSDEIILEEMISLVYDELGEAVASRWFDEYFKYETKGIH